MYRFAKSWKEVIQNTYWFRNTPERGGSIVLVAMECIRTRQVDMHRSEVYCFLKGRYIRSRWQLEGGLE